MNIFRKPITEIVAIDKELDRLHELIRSTTKNSNAVEIWGRIKILQDILTEIAKKRNRMEVTNGN